MNVSIAALGFPLTASLKQACLEASETIFPRGTGRANVSVHWSLSLEGHAQVAHVGWKNGTAHGDASVSDDILARAIAHAAETARKQVDLSRGRQLSARRILPPLNGTVETNAPAGA